MSLIYSYFLDVPASTYLGAIYIAWNTVLTTPPVSFLKQTQIPLSWPLPSNRKRGAKETRQEPSTLDSD